MNLSLKTIKNFAIATVAGLALVSTATISMADDQSDGCGVGWAITKKHSLSATTTRGTTNSSLPPTFGMTSGTSGCARHGLAKKDVEAYKFAIANFENLSIEMAQGQGEYLQAFARTLGCSDSATATFGTMSQKNYKALFHGTSSGADLLINVQQQIRSSQELTGSCGAA